LPGLLALFEHQGLGDEIAHFRRSEVLDRAGVDVGGFFGPLVALRGEELERLAVQLDQRLADDRLVMAVAAFDVHHHGDRNAAGDPFGGRFSGVADARHIAGAARADQRRGVEAEAVAVVCVVVRRRGAAAFVAEEVNLGAEFAVVFSGDLQGLELGADHLGEQLFGFDQRNLDVAVRVAVVAELDLDLGRQRQEHRGGVFAQLGVGEFDLVGLVHRVDLLGVGGEDVVELGDQGLHFRDEFDQAFRNQRDAEIHSGGGAGGDDVGDAVDDLAEGHLLLGDFLGDDRDVRLGLERAFESDVRRRAAHQLDEVPVFLGRVRVAADVADEFAVDAAGGVEAEAGFDPLVLEVAVDGLRAADHLDRNVVALEVFSQHAGVGVGVVAADDDQRGDAELFAVGAGRFELFVGFKLGPAGADHVEAAGVAVGVDDRVVEFHVLVFDQAVRSLEEAEELVRLVERLEAVVESGDDVVAAGGLSAGEDHADADRVGLGAAARFEGQRRAAERGLEDRLDLFNVGHSGGRRAFVHLDVGAFGQRGREFRGVGGARLLERRDAHDQFPVFD